MKDNSCCGSSVSMEISYSLRESFLVLMVDWQESTYRSFPSIVITKRVDPASPQGCQSIFAMGADPSDA
jgi:hypothetical protein